MNIVEGIRALSEEKNALRARVAELEAERDRLREWAWALTKAAGPVEEYLRRIEGFDPPIYTDDDAPELVELAGGKCAVLTIGDLRRLTAVLAKFKEAAR
jgi:hypothetical protein